MDTRWAHSLGLAVGLAITLAPAAGRAAGVEWLQKPTAKDFVAAYPPRAATEFMAGKASIGCKANPDGYLVDCKVISEAPADYGFGDAAVALSAKIRLSLPAGASRDIVLPLRFDPPIRQPEPIFQQDPKFTAGGGAGPYYPDAALRAKQAGQATLECLLKPSGRLDGCKLVSEAPMSKDFGGAALTMARKGWVTAAPRSVGGLPLAAEDVQVTIPFRPDAR